MEQTRSRLAAANDHALVLQPVRRMEERADKGRESRELSNRPRRRKAKRARHQAPAPQPKPMWPVVVGAVFIVLYICSPVDIIPDVPVIGAWDDIALAILGMRKLDKRRKDNEEAQRHFHHNREQPKWRDDYDRPRQPMSQQPYAMGAMLPPEKPGFFARVLKAISMIFGG